MNMKKAQVAVEFLIYSTIFLIIVMGAYFTISFMQTAEVSNKEALYVKWFGESFASYTNTAMNGQEGFNYTIKFNTKILNLPYEVNFKPAGSNKNGFVFITWSKNNLTYSYPIGNSSLLNGTCVKNIIPPSSENYYEINTSRGMLNFYNDGKSITLSQTGCT